MSTPPSEFSLIRRLSREHIRPHRTVLTISVVCMIVISLCISANTYMMQPALDMIFIARDEQMLRVIPIGILCISLLGALAHYGNTLAMRYLGQRMIADMQTRLFKHLMHCDLALFHEQSSGRLISSLSNDIMLMRQSFTNALTGMAKDSLSILFLIGIMFYHNHELALLSLSVFPIAFYPIILLSKKLRRYADKSQTQLANFTATLDEVFHCVRTVKSYNREDFESARASNMIDRLFAGYYKAARLQAAATPLVEVLGSLSMALVIWYGGYQVLENKITSGAFFSFMVAFLMAYKPIRSIAGLNGTLQEGIAAAARFFGVLDMVPAIRDREGARPLMVQHGGNICFDNVHYAYPVGGRGVHGISLDIPAGKKVALVGMSGGGKSTLMNLLMRFDDVKQGSIRIDGQDIRDVTLHSLRQSMAYVPQESMLFDDTVAANIAYGREGASHDDIVQAAQAAAADAFIRELPEGYETMIGAHGIRLSGGQRQRIAIARAMLKNAPILLLDEATSSLDNESERLIQQALATLMQGRTTLVIAHRLSTVIYADRIYVIGAGRTLEWGTHEELLAARGAYYKLYSEHAHAEP